MGVQGFYQNEFHLLGVILPYHALTLQIKHYCTFKKLKQEIFGRLISKYHRILEATSFI